MTRPARLVAVERHGVAEALVADTDSVLAYFSSRFLWATTISWPRQGRQPNKRTRRVTTTTLITS